MILDSIYTLSAFPYEKIGIFLNNTAAPETSARLGIRFRNNYYPNGNLLLNWNQNLKLNQGGLEPSLLSVPALASYYDPFNVGRLVQPTNFINVPSYFPVFFELSAIPYHNLFLNFKGGTSAISIFPSQPYPILRKISNRVFSVSGGYLPLSASNQDVLKEVYFRDLNESVVTPLANRGMFIHFPIISSTGPGGTTRFHPEAFYSASKNNFLWKTVTTNPLTNLIFDNEVIPANMPYDKNIIPNSFQVSFPISGAGISFPFQYTLSYSHTEGTTHILSGLPIERITNPIVLSAVLDATNGRISTILNPVYNVPKSSRITVSYETSANSYLPSAGSSYKQGVTALSAGNNYYQLSADTPPYLYNYRFMLSGTTLYRDGFTINFTPSAFLINTGYTSSVNVSTVMVDNYNQIHFPILENSNVAITKFRETTNDQTLSAKDLATNIIYAANSWIPASACLQFINNGSANSHTIVMQMSANNNSIYEVAPLTFILNKDQALFNLILNTQSDTSANFYGVLFPSYDPNLNVTWSAYPPENLEIRDRRNNQLITLGEPRTAGFLDVNVYNLGVDATTLTLYSQEFDISASSTWNPSSSVYVNTTLAISGYIDDFPRIKQSSISAVCIKNAKVYPAPRNANITWNESINDPSGVFEFRDLGKSLMFENSVYSSVRNYTNLSPTVLTNEVTENPRSISFNVNANLFGPTYSLYGNKIFTAREYPSNAFLYANLVASDGSTANSLVNATTFYTSSVTISATAYTGYFQNLSGNQIYWTLPNGSIVQGLTAQFTIDTNYCLTFSAISAKPAIGGFGYYTFTDQICLYVLSGGPPLFDFIAIPEYQCFPTNKLSFANYTSSVGLTAISNCENQNILISATGGFDEYVYRIGPYEQRSNSNITTISLVYSALSSDGFISVFGYNEIFSENNPITIYNSASSDDSSVFRQSLSWVDFPQLTAVLTVDSALYNMRNKPSTYFNTTISYEDDTGISINDATWVYVLSSTEEVKISGELYNNTGQRLSFSLLPEDFFATKENEYSIFNLYISGNIVKSLDFGLCSYTQPITSNIISITAYDGPDLDIFVENHLYETGAYVEFSNEMNKSFPNTLDHIVFDDGNGNTQTVVSYYSTLTGYYDIEGVFSPSMTAYFSDIDPITRTWDNYIIVKDSYDVYAPSITREFTTKLALPYTCEDILISPNSWQFARTINDSLDKIHANVDYLSSMAYSFDVNFAKHFVGWAGEKNGKFQWRWDDTYTGAPYYSDEITEIRDMVFAKNNIVLIDKTNIEIRQNTFTLSALYSSNHITEGEVFANPTRVVYSEPLEKLVVLDSSKKIVYVFDIINNNALEVTHYWGGLGERTSRTKLNNPVDLATDSLGYIYIVDADSRIVKVYNHYLNWINKSIEHDDWTSTNRPIAIALFNDRKFIMTETGKVYVFDEESVYQYSFQTIGGTRIYANDQNEGTLYIVTNNDIACYAFNGIYMEKILNPRTGNPVGMVFKDGEMYIFTSNIIVKAIDYLKINRVKVDDYTPYLWDWEQMRVDENEPVTDFVFNDIFKKVSDNLFLFGKDIRYKYVNYINEYDAFYRQAISAIDTSEILLSSLEYSPLGINEIVTWETINRNLNKICGDMNYLLEMLQPRETRDTFDSNCWTWKRLKIQNAQNLSNIIRPYSWIETQIENATESLSGIYWMNLRSCAGETNHYPLCWVWEYLSCDCVTSIRWEQTECGSIYQKKWMELEDECCKNPSYYFDDCKLIC